MRDLCSEPVPNLQRAVLETTRRFWGFDALRPLQAEAIAAGLARRDSLVVMPTGGGKSLCYQVPPVVAGRTDVVVSPLIALMKDQVDGLRECGYPAAAVYSGMSAGDVRQVELDTLSGKLKLLFAAPERLLAPRFIDLMGRARITSFAIDEAHCISHWGHDFRPEYRRLAELRDHFPEAGLHAFTATATQRVRDDIIAQLRLRSPEVLVGSFDRANLVYRIVPRVDVYSQSVDILRRHAGQAAIVYCISRRETEDLAAWLRQSKFRAAHYHAGMSAEDRRRTQDAFSEEKLDIIVATVAFGMGIDRSDVRCVLHAAMPKSVEHYQQEAGRAGRDGLEAECIMLYSAADVMRWERLIDKSAEEAERPEEVAAGMRELLGQMRSFAGGYRCRHRALVEHFGQTYETHDCGACDVCLGESDGEDGTVAAQKILSCVARVEQRFGAVHVMQVLRGAATANIRSFGHDRLSTYALMKDTAEEDLKRMLYQLLDQGFLDRSPGDRPVLRLNARSWEVMRGQAKVLFRRAKGEFRRTRVDEESWDGVDRELFEVLRQLRRTVAEELSVPAFIVFGDSTLRDLARRRPSSRDALLRAFGVGQRKADAFGDRFLAAIAEECHRRNLPMDAAPPPAPFAGTSATPTSRQPRPPRPTAACMQAFEMFARRAAIDEVVRATGRTESTVCDYLARFIEQTRPADVSCWVPPERYARIADAARRLGMERLKPIFLDLNEQVSYGQIRVVAAHLRATPTAAPASRKA